MLHLLNLLACEGGMMISAKRKGECVVGQVRGGALQARAVGDLLGLCISLACLVICQGVRRYIIIIIGVAESVRERKDIGVEVGIVVDAVAVVIAEVNVVVAEVDVRGVEILRVGIVGDSVAVAGAEVNVESIEILKVSNIGDGVAVAVVVVISKGSVGVDVAFAVAVVVVDVVVVVKVRRRVVGGRRRAGGGGVSNAGLCERAEVAVRSDALGRQVVAKGEGESVCAMHISEQVAGLGHHASAERRCVDFGDGADAVETRNGGTERVGDVSCSG